ncbi:hypothetical protein TPHA_0D00260 [Tetrapisispora phaffii CBS 4417]|uniref:DUF788 domain protein n=1 Tax=Tetrapisispora phaffii (strain ATCC 24235 / CBS 4417 / NBRC 1672 / NRRL Y-8282 / UCD 70-5) TaxID=1071381 RepID=G8BS49_TETPH|nr:hypothetical protein TPHA_0D00260 [Tetrapisispora phaffii CBS 4417]CCE62670.1 hypothetical protein TPHA_0D00260 [Tetrapisispora phaffii CBS 4417]
MAGNATKKQANANNESLNTLYKLSIPIVLLSYLRVASVSQLVKNTVFNVPLMACLYVFEKNARPTYRTEQVTGGAQRKRLVHEGSLDLNQQGGLTEYMFDMIYLSLAGNLGKFLLNTNKVWYVVYVVIPLYVLYKINGLKNQFFGSKDSKQAGPDGGISKESAPSKSKRQTKREQRGDKAQVRYR